MVTEPGKEITWGEIHVGAAQVFADAGFTQVSRANKTPACDADRVLVHGWAGRAR